MKEVWLVVREDRHLDDKYWVCETEALALQVANAVVEYFEKQYRGVTIEEVDNELYDDLIFHHHRDDAFRVYVKKELVYGGAAPEIMGGAA